MNLCAIARPSCVDCEMHFNCHPNCMTYEPCAVLDCDATHGPGHFRDPYSMDCVPNPECHGGQHWDDITMQCECPQLQVFDHESMMCVDHPECTGGQHWEDVRKHCECPQLQVFDHESMMCVDHPECTGGQHWEDSRKHCECPQHQYFDHESMMCVPVSGHDGNGDGGFYGSYGPSGPHDFPPGGTFVVTNAGHDAANGMYVPTDSPNKWVLLNDNTYHIFAEADSSPEATKWILAHEAQWLYWRHTHPIGESPTQ